MAFQIALGFNVSKKMRMHVNLVYCGSLLGIFFILTNNFEYIEFFIFAISIMKACSIAALKIWIFYIKGRRHFWILDLETHTYGHFLFKVVKVTNLNLYIIFIIHVFYIYLSSLVLLKVLFRYIDNNFLLDHRHYTRFLRFDTALTINKPENGWMSIYVSINS
jgi:hypothetical protein